MTKPKRLSKPLPKGYRTQELLNRAYGLAISEKRKKRVPSFLAYTPSVDWK